MAPVRRFPPDPDALLREQYPDSRNLGSRLGLHDRFSTNPTGWHRWVFAQLDLEADARVLELGCGPAALWQRNLALVPSGWEVTLSDFSPGMLEDARRALAGSPREFAFETIEASSIPHPEARFDAVIANHMLYHVPARDRALREMCRVMRPGGRLFAATNGRAHMREMDALVERFASAAASFDLSGDFGLENGREQLDPFFERVDLLRYEDGLDVTEAGPLLDYMLSAATGAAFSDESLDALRAFVEERIRLDGAFRVTKEVGLFVAHAPA